MRVHTFVPFGMLKRGRYLARMLACSTALSASCHSWAQAAPILPDGGRVASGIVSIGPAVGGNLTITQSSPTGIVNWNGFSIGTGGTVRLENGSGATLNRVDGPAVSHIDGSLQATGSVYLINPRGVIVGKTGTVQVGGSFITSTLDIADADFLDGGDHNFAGPSTASVVNLGKVGALGGDVALIATTIRNEGTISAPLGEAALAAGSRILVRDAELDGGRFVVLAGGSGTSVTNSGTVTATVAELRANGGSIYALAGNISGIIAADTVTGNDGRVFLTAGDGGAVRIANGTISARTPSYGGEIDVSGDTVEVAPAATIDVSASIIGGQVYYTANQKLTLGGTTLARGVDQGGSVWTLSPIIDLANASVDTSGGVTGTWTIDQPSVTIDSKLASNLNRYLHTNNVAILANPADFGGGSANGDLTIAAPVTVSGANQLTLLAANTIRVDQTVTVAGVSVLNLYAFGSDAAGSPISFAPNRSITFTGPVHGAQALYINDDQYTLIYSVADLKAMQANPGGTYALARSFAASGNPLSGPAVGGQGSDPFSGTFEGLGHSINGLRINAPGTYLVGLFGDMQGTVRNVSLVGGSVVGGSEVGALVAYLDQGSVIHASSSASVTARGSALASGVGGLVGSNYLGNIADTSSTGTVYAPGASMVGGLVGSQYGSDIQSSFATGDVTGGEDTGGVIGSLSRSGISDSYATGRVSGTLSVGGLAGIIAFGGTNASYATGAVSGSNMVGGLVGNMLDATATNVYATGNVTATIGQGGGLVGYLSEGDVEQASATGRVNGGSMIGGLVGLMTASNLTDSNASGRATGTSDVGGLIGTSSGGTIYRVAASGAVNRASGAGENSGGLIGRSENDQIGDAAATNAVRGRTNVGGLIGHRSGGSLTNGSATGTVSGTRNVGQLIGLDDPAP